DVVEDTEVTSGCIERWFGPEVAALVFEVTDISRPEHGNRQTRKEIDRMHLSKSSPEGASIKLADMIDNTSSIVENDPEFAKVYLVEKRDLLGVLGHGHSGLFKQAQRVLSDAEEKLKGNAKGRVVDLEKHVD
ncbi:MAG: HD domain-containing protein, partial [Geminicoccaceae bacterium]